MTLKQYLWWGACTLLAVVISVHFNINILGCFALGFSAAIIGIMIGSK